MSEDQQSPKTGKDTIYIDVEDEITSIIDKVEGTKEKVVALVLPKRATALQSIVNMRLLKRGSDAADKDIVLVTSEAALLPLAGAARIHVAKNLSTKPEIPPAPGMPADPAPALREDGTGPVKINVDKAEEDPANLPKKINYEKSIGDLAAAHEIEHPETIELGDELEPVAEAAAATEKLPKAPKDKALKVPNFDRFRLWLGLGVAGALALIIFIFMALFVLPKATITLTTTSTPVSANFNLTTSDKATALDTKKGIIPAILKSSDQTQTTQVTATGQQNNGAKASGSVNFTATECGSIKPASDVSAGTGLTSNGVRFTTQSATRFSSSGTVNGNCISYPATAATSVIAQNGGTKYNLASGSSFAVDGRSDVTGTGSTSGGTDDIKTIVSQNDVDSAKQKVTSASSDSFTKTFQDNLAKQDYYVLTSTLKIGDAQTTASPDVGQAASNTSVTVKVTYTVLVVKKADLTAAIQNAVASQIDKSKQKVENTDLIKGAQVTVSNQTSPTVATLSITEDASAVPIIDTASVAKQAAGQKSGDITANLSSIPGVKDVNVKLQPFWVSKAPKKTSKIKVILHHVASKNG